MVALGTGLLALSAWFAFVWWRKRRLPEGVWFWRFASLSGVGAIVALEAGWVTTELGRQPWVVYGIVRTADAVSKADGIVVTAAAITVTYLVLGAVTLTVLRLMSRSFAKGEEVAAPYGPERRQA